MRIAFIETNRLTNELIRAVAGAAPNCVGYPDGVPESWRDDSAAVASQWESTGGPIDMGVLTVGVSSLQRVPEMPGKHFIRETRDRLADLEYVAAAHSEHIDDLEQSLRGGDAFIADPDAGDAVFMCGGELAGELRRFYERDDPEDWPDERGDDEC